MDIDTLKEIITNSIVDNVFTFPNDTYTIDSLGSETITNLFSAYLDNSTLVINDVDVMQTSDKITLSGPGGSLPFISNNLNVAFSLNDSQETTMVALAVAQTGWTFATSYPVLENTILPELTFEEGHGFSLASVASDDTPYGLAFHGNLQLSGALSAITWLLGDGTSLAINGPIQMHQTIPEMSLTTQVVGMVELGYFTIPAVTFELASSLVPPDDDTGEEPPGATAVMHLSSSIQFHAEDTNVTLPIIADFYNRATYLQFRTDLNDAIVATLTELSSLMGGADLLGLLQEEGVDLTNYLALDELIIQIDPSTQTLLSVTMGIHTTQPWTLLTDQNYGTVFAVDDIDLSFRVRDPLGTADLSLAVFGELNLMDQTELQVSAMYPNFIVNGKLEENTVLNLSDIVQYFLGTHNPDVPAINLTYLQFFAEPGASNYEASATVESDWPINLGITTLTINEVDFAIDYTDGNTHAHIGGGLTIGPAQILVNWDLPGDLQILGTIEQISLSDIVEAISSEPMRSDFPDLTLDNTQLLIAKYQDDGYFIAFGTTVEGFGTLELDFKEVMNGGASTTGFAFGFALPANWSLSDISDIFSIIDFLTFRGASLTLSSYTDPNFTFRGLGGDPLQSPFSPAGVQAGMGFYAALDLNNDNDIIQTLDQLLPGLADEGLVISALIPTNYSDTILTAAIENPLTILSVTTHLNSGTQQTSITFNEFSASITPLHLTFDLHVDVTFVIFDESLRLSGDVALEEEEVLLEVRTETPWVNPFGIHGLTLNQVAIEFELGAILAITLAGTITLGTGNSAVMLHAAAEFNIDEEGIPDVFLAETAGTISLPHIIGSFVGDQNVPTDIIDIELRNFTFLIVANPFGWTDPGDQKHYSPGLAFSGELELYGLIADFALIVDYSTGIYASGQLSQPITVGPLTLANGSDPDAGPFIVIQSAQSPYVNMSVAFTLFEITAKLDARIENNAFALDFSYNVGSVGTFRITSALGGNFHDGYTFAFHASLYLYVDSNLINIKVGRYQLGFPTIPSLFLDAHFDLDIGPGVNLDLSLGANFWLNGYNMTLPDTGISITSDTFTSFTQLAAEYAIALSDQLWDIGAELFQDVEALFESVADGLFMLTDDIGDILKHVFHTTIDAAAQLLASVADIMAYDLDFIVDQLDDGWHAAEDVVAAALKSAQYIVDDVAEIIGDYYNKAAEEVAQILRDAGYAVDEIAQALYDVYDWTAQEVAEFFSDVWHLADEVVNDALEFANYAVDEIESAMNTVYGWVVSGVDTVVYYADPHHW